MTITFNGGHATTRPPGDDSTNVATTEFVQGEVQFTQTGTGAVSRRFDLKLRERVSVRDFGAVGDGVTNDRSAFINAIYAAKGDVFVPAGEYLIDGVIEFSLRKGTSLVGEGESREGSVVYPTILKFTHVGAAAIKLRASGQSLQNLVVQASGARASASRDTTSFGVLIEPPDTSGASVADSSLRNISIVGHPSSGLVSSGPNFMLLWDGIAVKDCKAHAFVIDWGYVTSRTNTGRSGGFIVKHPRTYGNGGHSFVTGDLSNFGVYRLLIDDADFDDHQPWGAGIDPAIKVADACAIFHGENIITRNCAFNGRLAGVADYAAMQVSGRVHRHVANRYVGVNHIAHIVKAVSTITTDDIEFDGVYATDDSTAAPAFTITGTVGTTIVMAPLGAGPGQLTITDWFTGGYVNGVLLSSAAFSVGFKNFLARRVSTDAADPAAVAITGASSETGMTITRTGTGAATGKLTAAGGNIELATTTSSDLVLKRNGTERLRLKSSTVNLASLPTSTSGLVTGDLWNDGGTVKVV